MATKDPFSKYVNPQQLIGKSVLDSKGSDCGKIKSLYIDKKTFCVVGIMLKKKLSKEYFISKDYFENITKSGITLNSVPIKPYQKVVDVKGKLIGRIVSINRNLDTDQLESIEVKFGFKSKVILSDEIVGIGDKITVRSS